MKKDLAIPLPSAENGVLCRVVRMETKEPLRRRLRELGLIEGTLITKIYSAPFGDPSAYVFCGAVTAIRGKDAEGIFVEICG